MELLDINYIAELNSLGSNSNDMAGWISAIGTIAAVLVAFFALIKSVQANKNSFKPFIRVYYCNYENHIEIGLKNYGNGPGILNDYRAWIGDRDNQDTTSRIQDLLAQNDIFHNVTWTDYLIRQSGVVIAAGGSEPLIKLQQEHIDHGIRIELRQFLNQVRFSYSYQNFLGEEMENGVIEVNPGEVFEYNQLNG